METTILPYFLSSCEMPYLIIMILLVVIFMLIRRMTKQSKLVKQMEEKISTYHITNRNFSFPDSELINGKEKITEEPKKIIKPDYLNLPKRKDRHK